MDGRYAPSPTSDLHVGNLRTALLAWLYARATGSRFVMRIEDLDQQRVAAAPAVAEQQLADLRLIGLDWDETVRQSDRLDLYREALAGLEIYECFCTRREIAQASQAPHGDYRPYPGTCAVLTAAQRAAKRRERPGAIRVRAHGATMTIQDRFAGAVTGVVDDFVLFRADGNPAYNLATVLDDGLQGVAEVVRGGDLLGSSPRQAWLAAQLGFAPPVYTHVGLVLNEAGQRLAKRDGAATLAQLRQAGLTSDEVFERIASSCGLRGRTAAECLGEAQATPGLLSDPTLAQPWTASDLITGGST